MKQKTKDFFKIAGLSFLLFLCVTWMKSYEGIANWVESIAFFSFTWMYALKAEKKGLSATFVAMAVIFGRIFIEIPMRVYDFHDCYGSLFLAILSVACIVLGAICANEKRNSVYALAIVILLLCNTFVNMAWEEHLRNYYLPTLQHHVQRESIHE